MAAIFQAIFWNGFSWMKLYDFRLNTLLKFVPKGPINNIPALVQIMTWRRPSDKPLSEPMMVNSLTHICVSRLQWVKMWGTGIEIRAKYSLFSKTCLPVFIQWISIQRNNYCSLFCVKQGFVLVRGFVWNNILFANKATIHHVGPIAIVKWIRESVSINWSEHTCLGISIGKIQNTTELIVV